MRLFLLALALLSGNVALANGYFAGWIAVDETHHCTVKNGTDAESLTCSFSQTSEYDLPTVTLDYHGLGLKTPPVCTLTGLTLKGQNGGLNGAGAQPVVSDLTTTKLRFVLNNLQDCPCQYGGMALFTCIISN